MTNDSNKRLLEPGEYFPSPEDIKDLNEAAKKITHNSLSDSLCAVAISTAFFKELSKKNYPSCVDMSMKGITKEGAILAKRIYLACGYSTNKPIGF